MLWVMWLALGDLVHTEQIRGERSREVFTGGELAMNLNRGSKIHSPVEAEFSVVFALVSARVLIPQQIRGLFVERPLEDRLGGEF
jgi:hypothetical protein